MVRLPIMARILRILGILTILTASSQAVKLPRYTPKPSLHDSASIRKIIEGLGMVYESHQVVTEDGYVLNLNRMVNPKLQHQRDKGIPVLLVNGLAMWSDAWFIQPVPINNPPVAWLLRGYDVWLGDQRGTWRSRRHKTMTSLWWKFWDFSFHEVGVYDLPAYIDFILSHTGHSKVAFSGVSNSAAYYYILCSERPEYQDKLHGAILFAPVAEVTPLSSMKWGEYLNIFDGGLLLNTFWTFGFGAYPPIFSAKWDFYAACKLMSPDLFIGMSKLTMGSGCKFHKDDFCTRISQSLGGTSVKTVVHTTQLFSNGGKFCQYDYGVIGNYAKYGQTSPPKYNVSKVRVPTALYYSDTDVWAPSRVVEPFAKRLRGPTYRCMTHGVCHVYHLLDPRSGPFIKDTSHVLDSMTGRTNSTKLHSKKCKIKW